MPEWAKLGSVYTTYGYKIRAKVYQDGEFWRHVVFIDGDGDVSKGEWPDRESAFRNANGGMSRATFLRRFQKDPPVLPDDHDDDDGDDDEDDD